MNNDIVYLKDCLKELDLKAYDIPIILGKNKNDNIVVKDLVEIPNILMAGATGTGKSTFLNSVIYTLLKNKTLKELKFVMIDPKQVELPFWDGIPHLLHPVVTSHDEFYSILKACVEEMKERADMDNLEDEPYILILVDEFSDLMFGDSNVPDLLYKLAEKGSKVKIHMILSTSSPREKVFTEEIRELIPGRLTGALATEMESKRVLGVSGAEELMGNGEMIYRNLDINETLKVQAPFLSSEETQKLGGIYLGS